MMSRIPQVNPSASGWQYFKKYITEPFKEENKPQVKWTPAEGIMVILVSTLLFALIVFGGFYLAVVATKSGILQFPQTIAALGLQISTQQALDLEIITGFEMVSLFILENFGLFIVGGIILQVLLQTAVLLFYTKIKYGAGMKELGFRMVPVKTILWMGAVMMVLSVLIQNGFFGLYALLGISNAADNGAAEQMITNGGIPLPVLFIFAGLVAPLLEEVIFRGFYLSGKAKASGMVKALIYSSIFFALAHLNPSAFFPEFTAEGMQMPQITVDELISTFILMPVYFSLGLLLGFAFIRSKSLYPGVFFHMINNNAALMLLLWKLNEQGL
jgi:membrane protease YdiL (CAAX protease family)